MQQGSIQQCRGAVEETAQPQSSHVGERGMDRPQFQPQVGSWHHPAPTWQGKRKQGVDQPQTSSYLARQEGDGYGSDLWREGGYGLSLKQLHQGMGPWMSSIWPCRGKRHGPAVTQCVGLDILVERRGGGISCHNIMTSCGLPEFFTTEQMIMGRTGQQCMNTG